VKEEVEKISLEDAAPVKDKEDAPEEDKVSFGMNKMFPGPVNDASQISKSTQHWNCAFRG
jgi:hypothetical protein